MLSVPELPPLTSLARLRPFSMGPRLRGDDVLRQRIGSVFHSFSQKQQTGWLTQQYQKQYQQITSQNQALPSITRGYHSIPHAIRCIPVKYLLTTPEAVPIVP
jgi:hypothetical protein